MPVGLQVYLGSWASRYHIGDHELNCPHNQRNIMCNVDVHMLGCVCHITDHTYKFKAWIQIFALFRFSGLTWPICLSKSKLDKRLKPQISSPVCLDALSFIDTVVLPLLLPRWSPAKLHPPLWSSFSQGDWCISGIATRLCKQPAEGASPINGSQTNKTLRITIACVFILWHSDLVRQGASYLCILR